MKAERGAGEGPDDHQDAKFGSADADIGHLMDVVSRGANIGVGRKEQVAEKDRQGGDQRQVRRQPESDDDENLREQVAGMVNEKAKPRPFLLPVSGQRPIQGIAKPVHGNADGHKLPPSRSTCWQATSANEATNEPAMPISREMQATSHPPGSAAESAGSAIARSRQKASIMPDAGAVVRTWDLDSPLELNE